MIIGGTHLWKKSVSMTELELQQRIKDEAFISATAWVILLLAGMALYWSLVSGGMMQLILDAQDRAFGEPPGGVPGDFMAEIQKTQQRILLIVGVLGLGSVLLIVTAVAVLKRRRWGRMLMTVAMLVLVAVALFLVFYVGRQSLLRVNELALRIPGDDQDFSRSFHLGTRLQYLSYGLFVLLACWLMIRTVIKLNRPRIRALFS